MLTVVLFAAAAAIVNASNAKTVSATKNTNNIYTEDKQNILVVSDHPEFVIKLKSNPTTGFAWFLREYDANLVQPVKHKFVAPNVKLMGAPGYEVWTFRIKPAGFVVPHQSSIRFVYTRPWQQGMDSSTQVVFRVMTQ